MENGRAFGRLRRAAFLCSVLAVVGCGTPTPPQEPPRQRPSDPAVRTSPLTGLSGEEDVRIFGNGESGATVVSVMRTGDAPGRIVVEAIAVSKEDRGLSDATWNYYRLVRFPRAVVEAPDAPAWAVAFRPLLACLRKPPGRLATGIRGEMVQVLLDRLTWTTAQSNPSGNLVRIARSELSVYGAAVAVREGRRLSVQAEIAMGRDDAKLLHRLGAGPEVLPSEEGCGALTKPVLSVRGGGSGWTERASGFNVAVTLTETAE